MVSAEGRIVWRTRPAGTSAPVKTALVFGDEHSYERGTPVIVKGLDLSVQGVGSMVWGVGFRIWGVTCGVRGADFRV